MESDVRTHVRTKLVVKSLSRLKMELIKTYTYGQNWPQNLVSKKCLVGEVLVLIGQQIQKALFWTNFLDI